MLTDFSPHTLKAEGLYQAHLTPYLEEAQTALNAKLETTQKENTELAAKILEQRKEIETLLTGLEAVMADLEESAKASTTYSKSHNLRAESLEMDKEIQMQIES